MTQMPNVYYIGLEDTRLYVLRTCWTFNLYFVGYFKVRDNVSFVTPTLHIIT
jgi:hypothetical protein